MSSEIIQNVAYDNYDDFQHVNFIFSQNFISLFGGLFNDEFDLRLRSSIPILIRPCLQSSFRCSNFMFIKFNLTGILEISSSWEGAQKKR